MNTLDRRRPDLRQGRFEIADQRGQVSCMRNVGAATFGFM